MKQFPLTAMPLSLDGYSFHHMDETHVYYEPSIYTTIRMKATIDAQEFSYVIASLVVLIDEQTIEQMKAQDLPDFTYDGRQWSKRALFRYAFEQFRKEFPQREEEARTKLKAVFS